MKAGKSGLTAVQFADKFWLAAVRDTKDTASLNADALACPSASWPASDATVVWPRRDATATDLRAEVTLAPSAAAAIS